MYANYNSENICRAMGMGGFANDWPMVGAEYALRILFKASFSPELCLTFIQKEGSVKVNLVAAQALVWQQDSDVPKSTPVIQSQANIDQDHFTQLLDMLMLAECALKKPESITINDGIIVHTVLRGAGYGLINIGDSMANHQAYSSFYHAALDLARSSMKDLNAQLAFRHFASPNKWVCRTLVLGEQEENAQIMSALHKLHN